MDKTWTAADSQLLRELRTATGMDRATFARRNTLSVGQLTELEDGGKGRFYSENIKAHTGRTLLTKLGHVQRVVEVDRMDAVTAAAPAPAPSPAPAATPAQAARGQPCPGRTRTRTCSDTRAGHCNSGRAGCSRCPCFLHRTCCACGNPCPCCISSFGSGHWPGAGRCTSSDPGLEGRSVA